MTTMGMGTEMETTTDTGTIIDVGLTAPDISAYRRGNAGVDFATTFDSGAAGPHVMVNALTHGNEICGAIALDRLFKTEVRPTRGKLTLSFANVAAFQRFDPNSPQATRFVDEDFNRVWSADVLDGPRDSVELRRARAMRPLLDDVDTLLDIHSMHDPHRPVMIAGVHHKSIALAEAVGTPEYIVADFGHANGTRMRDYGGFGDADSLKRALLVECGQHWVHASVAVAWQTLWRFLRAIEVVDRERANAEISADALPATKVVTITDAVIARSNRFEFVAHAVGLATIARAGDIYAYDDGLPVRAPYDNCVLVMPTLVHAKAGLTVVRLGRIAA